MSGWEGFFGGLLFVSLMLNLDAYLEGTWRDYRPPRCPECEALNHRDGWRDKQCPVCGAEVSRWE
jgi:hypothetical protein